jgi:glycine/D-amino acid oxidase-like deaminating enzyme
VYDFAVVGAGIAGLAIAELLQRSGRSVLLLEAGDKACAHSSAQQQGWFHTGALYAALPSGRYFRQLVGNLDDLLNYYSGFPDMNLSSGRYLLTRKKEGWFKNSTNYYLYVRPGDSSLKLWQRPLWQLAILRAQMRLSWFETADFTRELSPQVDNFNLSLNLSRCLADRKFEFCPGSVSKTMKSRDRTFNAEWITIDLLNSFLGNGGKLKLNATVTDVGKGCVSDLDTTHKARYVIVAAGRDVERLSGVAVNVYKSPLLVVHPAIADVNFVWMTMNIPDTFNHLYHDSDQGNYSLIGNAVYFPVDQPVDETEIKKNLMAKAEKIFGKAIDDASSSLYFGYKTELQSGASARNYQYHIVNGRNCIVALPGKMSLAFSLAVNVCRHFGIDPVTEIGALDNRGASAAVGQPEHYKRFVSLLR